MGRGSGACGDGTGKPRIWRKTTPDHDSFPARAPRVIRLRLITLGRPRRI
jgi:hypothetical protein